jgi:hypothetical protein
MEAIKQVWKDRYTYAQYIAVVATFFNGLGVIALKLSEKSDWWMLLGGLTLVIGIALTLCAYCLGGLWTAVKAALNIAKWGWLLVPFPYDLAIGLFAFMIAMMVLFLFPVVPVNKAIKDYQAQQIR